MPDLLQIVAEPRRREILRLVWNHEHTAGDIAREFEVTFGAVSQHLKILRDARLVDMRKRGRERLYRTNKANLGPLAEHLTTLWRGHLRQLKQLAESEEKRHGRS